MQASVRCRVQHTRNSQQEQKGARDKGDPGDMRRGQIARPSGRGIKANVVGKRCDSEQEYTKVGREAAQDPAGSRSG